MSDSVPPVLPNGGLNAFKAILRSAQADFNEAFDDNDSNEDALKAYKESLLWSFSYLIGKFGMVAFLRSLHGFYAVQSDKFHDIPAALEPFLEGNRSYWSRLEASVRERWQHVWVTLLDEENLDDSIFTLWSAVEIGNLEREVEELFIESVQTEIAASVPAKAWSIDDLAAIQIPLSKSVKATLPAWEASAIIDRRRRKILSLLREQ